MQEPTTGQARAMAPPLFGVLTLAFGMTSGLVSVTLAYVLAHQGASTSEIAGLISLNLLPSTLVFLIGPVLDLSLDPRRWCLIGIVGTSVGAGLLAIIPLARSAFEVLDVDVLAMGLANSILFTAMSAAMAATTPDRRRGAVSAWAQAGAVGGIGVGGGLGLWIANHTAGFAVAALTIAALSLVSAAPLAILRTPPALARASLQVHLAGLRGGIVDLARTRSGVLAAIAVTIPTGIGAALKLMPAVADHWRASADLVAAATGVLGGLATVPGCILGGYLADRFARRPFFIATGLTLAASEAVMAFGPHTPLAFAVLVPFNAFVLGLGYAAVNTVIFEVLGLGGAATVCAILGSLSNVPLVAMTAFVGLVETARGATAMLAAEAAIGALAALAYAGLAWVWRTKRPVPEKTIPATG